MPPPRIEPMTCGSEAQPFTAEQSEWILRLTPGDTRKYAYGSRDDFWKNALKECEKTTFQHPQQKVAKNRLWLVLWAFHQNEWCSHPKRLPTVSSPTSFAPQFGPVSPPRFSFRNYRMKTSSCLKINTQSVISVQSIDLGACWLNRRFEGKRHRVRIWVTALKNQFKNWRE